MKTHILIIGVVALALAAALWAVNTDVVKAPGPQACTLEAKICPDGSAVGRTGPNCEFAACPSGGPVVRDARIGEEVGDLDVSITPLEVLEDSRCPLDVVCIQAGTVRMRARLVSGLGTARQEFKLGEPITTEAERVTLTDVFPAPVSTAEIKDGDYVFRFTIEKR